MVTTSNSRSDDSDSVPVVVDDEGGYHDDSVPEADCAPPRRPPLMLKNLMSFNKPGTKDIPFTVSDRSHTFSDGQESQACVEPALPRRSGRVKKNREVYDASTGLFDKPGFK